MATTTFQPYTGNGSNKTFNYSFPTYTASEVVVEVDGVVVDNYTIPGYQTTGTRTVTFDNSTGTLNTNLCESDGAPKNNLEVIIRRDTNIDTAKATYTAGSSLKAADLTDNNTQILRALQEEQNTPITTPRIRDGSITSAKIKDSTIVEADLANSAVTSNKIADNAVTTTEILNGAVTRAKLEADIIDGTKLADNAVNSEHYTDGSIDREHLAGDIVDGTKIADDAINTEHIADDAITNAQLANDSVHGDNIISGTIQTADLATGLIITGKLADNAVTIDKIADAAIVTNSEQASHSVDDNTFFTTAAAEARYFNASTGETIKDGQTFPDDDTTIATTAAINDRIIDLVDDVGGFVPIANETSFPTANPDVNNGAGTIVSVSAASTNLVPSGTTVTIANGRGSGLAVIITGVSATIPSGFGFLVETTTTDHTYAFHRLSPKATEVTTVASKATEVTTVHTNITNINAVANNATNINAVAADATDIGAVAAKATEIGRLGTADAVADMAILGTTDVVADLNTLGTADVVADMNMLATSDVVADMNMLAVSDVISDMNDLATSGNITAMSTCSTNIASINNASANISSANNFGDQYQVASNNPSTDGGGNALAAGDLYFNTSANELKVYNGSSWQGGVTAAGSFAATTGNTFTGDNRYNDGVKALFGTGSDLEIYHDGTKSIISNNGGTGNLILYGNGTNSVVIQPVVGENSIVANSNSSVELFYDNSKKLETTSSGATITGSLSVDGFNIGDSETGNFGSGNDLKLYHDGGNGSIQNITGELYLRTSGLHITNSGVTENMARFFENGAVELYHNNSKKLETTGTGTHIYGTLTVDEIDMTDNEKILLGTGDDLQLYHDGTNSIIDNTTGELRIQTDGSMRLMSTGLAITDENNSDTIINAQADGQVGLYYDNSLKFETTSWGAAVTGNFDASGSVEGSEFRINGTTVLNSSRSLYNLGVLELADNIEARFGSSNDLKIFHESSSNDNIIDCATTRPLRIRFGGSNQFEFLSGGGIKMNDGRKIFLGDSSDLQIYHDGSHSYIADTGTGNLNVLASTVNINNAANSENIARFIENGAVELYYDSSKKFETTNNGANITGGLNVSGGTTNNTNDAVLYVDKSNNNDWALKVKTNVASSTDYGIRIEGNTGASNLLTVSTNTDVFKVSGGGVVTATSFVGNGANLTGINTDVVSDTSPNLGGDLSTNGHAIHVLDNNRIYVGTGYDMEIYHDGSTNYIRGGSKNIDIRAVDGEQSIVAKAHGTVELYYDGGIKFETTSSGTHSSGFTHTFGASGAVPTLKAGGSNTDIRIAAVGTGGWVSFATGNSSAVQTDRWQVYGTSGHFVPVLNNTYDIGTTTYRVRNIYTNDLHLSNEGSSNDVDNSWGSWTIQEGESDLFLKNNRSGKKYKFNLTEVS